MRLFEKYILRRIKKCEIVSFDVYDTLIHRRCQSPDMVFKDIENHLKEIGDHNSDFFMRRCEAQYLARFYSAREEVSLDDIYDFYVSDRNNDKEILKKLEIEMETRCVYPDKMMKRIFDTLVKENKEVIVITDMYLPLATIHEILGRAGYFGYEKIYVSSDIGLTKSTGNLFLYVLKEYEGKRIIHIGDRFKSDYRNARKSSIQSIWYFYPKIYGVFNKYLRRHNNEPAKPDFE